MRRATFALGSAAMTGLFGCGDTGESADRDSAQQAGSQTNIEERMTRAEAPPSLRAAAIVAMQRGAGAEYDLDLVSDDPKGLAFAGELRALGRVLRLDAQGAAIARGTEEEAELGLQLENAGCAGTSEPVAPSQPAAERNRASYARSFGGGRTVEEWYVAGPLGLEQGFTIGESWGCAGELELDVAVGGARVEHGQREGELRLVSAANGERFRYGELAAWDAEGRPLTAHMEAREGGVRLVVDVAGAVYPVVVDPLVATEQAKLVAGDPGNSQLGFAVAVEGDTALVGARLGGGGSAYVFVRSGAVWTQQAKLTASDAELNETFGSSVALSGDTALVGAEADDDGGFMSGSAYVFVRNGAVWTQQAKLLAPDPAVNDNFGHSVAVSGDTALVGAHRHDDGGPETGSVYVFTRGGSAWNQQAKLSPIDAAAFDTFGVAVALSGNLALVGASRGAVAVGPGSAYVFVYDGTAWTQQAELTASDAVSRGQFRRLGRPLWRHGARGREGRGRVRVRADRRCVDRASEAHSEQLRFVR